MPTYEYECQKCGHRFDEFQSMTAKPLQRCPKCRGKLKRLIGAGAGLLFKGSGFYTTDYRKPGYQEKRKSDSSAGESGGGGAAKPDAGKAASPAKKSPEGGAAGKSGGKKAKGD
jgi:putative FmdB family regulatory protein